jgi:hypothetical protein
MRPEPEKLDYEPVGRRPGVGPLTKLALVLTLLGITGFITAISLRVVTRSTRVPNEAFLFSLVVFTCGTVVTFAVWYGKPEGKHERLSMTAVVVGLVLLCLVSRARVL